MEMALANVEVEEIQDFVYDLKNHRDNEYIKVIQKILQDYNLENRMCEYTALCIHFPYLIRCKYFHGENAIPLTVFCFSVEFKDQYALLSVYIVLFAFQRRFISIREGMNRIAAYTAVYLDDPTGWEAQYLTTFQETCVKNKQIVKMSRIIE